jgi:hypothetical protein
LEKEFSRFFEIIVDKNERVGYNIACVKEIDEMCGCSSMVEH